MGILIGKRDFKMICKVILLCTLYLIVYLKYILLSYSFIQPHVSIKYLNI